MKLRRVRAAEADPREYLAGANAAFGDWGDEARFAWAFRGDSELLFLEDDGRVLAGSGVTFRTLCGGGSAAIISGAWTLPEARRRGGLTQIVEATREIARRRDGVVLAFMRSDNPSRRRLAAAGARMHPTYYCRSLAAVEGETLEPADVEASMFPSSFVYTPAEWRAQFLERPGTRIECIGRRGEWSAVVERATESDRVHAVSDERALPHLAARAHAAGRRLFWFTSKRSSLTCEWTDGFLTELGASSVSDWILQNGDRM